MKKKKKDDHVQFVVGSFYLRVCILVVIGFVIFASLILRLWQMQILQYEEYLYKDQKQSARRIRIPATRGEILASDGTQIVRNRPSYNVSFHPEEIKVARAADRANTLLQEIKIVSNVLKREVPLSLIDVQRHLNLQPGLPLTIFPDLQEAEVGRLAEIYPPLAGMEISVEPLRDYPYDSLAAHILGYVGYEDPSQESDRKAYFYYLTAMQGREGLELKYDDLLSGKPGSKLVMVNSSGFIYSEIGNTIPAEDGLDIRLTLDLKAQLVAEKAISQVSGSVVILDAESGAVLAMASSPTFSPKSFVPSISRLEFNKLRSDSAKPFLNRSTMGSYMPGSIIKPLVALAALEGGVNPNSTINCTGLSHYGYGTGIHCTALYGHGYLTMQEAIMRSCNVYFVDIGCMIGIAQLSKIFESAGIGYKTGIEIPERGGILPVDSRTWNENETAYVSIGQGRIEVTPIQAAVYFAAIANGGTMWKPYLVSDLSKKNSETGKRTIVTKTQPAIIGKLAASVEHIKIVQEGMHMVVHNRNGTGKQADIKEADVYGKTGTADVTENSLIEKNTWFAGFVRNPKNNRLCSFALVVENGKSGGGTAAPIIANILSSWFASE